MASDLWRMSVTELVEAIRQKQVSSREVIQAHLERIEAINPTVNAVTVQLAESALAAAALADQQLATGHAVGPLHGVPMTVKENIDLAGSATTHGIVAFKDLRPPGDAPHIAQLKAAGAIPIGRTNMPDFGWRWHTDNALRGATVNPWDASRTPGGSSGGDAVALATGMTPLGMGNDYAGSLRWPSQCCGTTALRPTLGRIPMVRVPERVPAMPLASQLFAVHGPMARHARDLRLALAAMSGPDPRDPWWVPAPLHGPEVASPIRVAVTIDPAHQGVDPQVAEAVRRAAAALADAGYAVEEMEPPALRRGVELFFQLGRTHGQLSVSAVRLEALASEDFLHVRRTMRRASDMIVGIPARDGLIERLELAHAWGMFQAKRPLILGPVATVQPFVVDFDTTASAEQALSWLQAVRLVVVVNLLGLPSVAIPVGVADGLPQSVQVIGPRYREDLCLDAAEAIEVRLGSLTPIDPR
jgi:amidase